MREPTASAGETATDDDQAIRDQVRAVTNQVLQQGRVDPEALRNVVRTLAGQRVVHAAPDKAEARERFADAVRGLDEALQKSARGTETARNMVESGLNTATQTFQRVSDQFTKVLGFSGPQAEELARRSSENVQAVTQAWGASPAAIPTCSSCGGRACGRRLECRSRMRRESHVRFWEGGGVQVPSATRPLVHCRSEAEARSVLEAIRGRL